MDTSTIAVRSELENKPVTAIMVELPHGTDRAVRNRPQSTKDQALARSFIYRFLARAYQVPDPDGWAWLNDSSTQSRLWSAIQVFSSNPQSALKKAGEEFALYLGAEDFDSFRKNYFTVFSTGLCKLTEADYVQPNAPATLQSERLHMLADSYRRNRLVPIARKGERIDHICFELEFVGALAAQEASAIGRNDPEAKRCSDARTAFLRDHLSRWLPQVTQRVIGVAPSNAFGALARFTAEFLKHEFQTVPKTHRPHKPVRIPALRAVELAR